MDAKMNFPKKKTQLDALLGLDSDEEEKAGNNKESGIDIFKNFVKVVNPSEMVRYSFMDQTKVFPGFIQNLKHMGPNGGETTQTMYFNTGENTAYISDRRGVVVEVNPVDRIASKKEFDKVKEMRKQTAAEYRRSTAQSNHNREKSPTGDVADEFLFQYMLSEEERSKENDGYVSLLNAIHYNMVFDRYSDFSNDPNDRAISTLVYVPPTDVRGQVVTKTYSDRETQRLRYFNVFNKRAPELEETRSNLHHGINFQKLNYNALLATQEPLIRIVTVKTFPAYVWRNPSFITRIRREFDFLCKRKGKIGNRQTYYENLIEFLTAQDILMGEPADSNRRPINPEEDILFITEETDIDIKYIKKQQESNKTLYLEEFDIAISFEENWNRDHPYLYSNSVYRNFQSQLVIPYTAGLQVNIIDNQNRLNSTLWVNFGHGRQTVYSITPVKDPARPDGLEYIVKLSDSQDPVRAYIPLGESIEDFLNAIKDYGIYKTQHDAINHARHSVGKEQVDLLKSELDVGAKKEAIEAERIKRELDLSIEESRRYTEQLKREAEMQIDRAKAERDELLKRQEYEYKEREIASKKTIESYKVVGAIVAVAATALGAALTVAKVMAKTVAVAAVGVAKSFLASAGIGLLGLLAF